jgi:hypothetical protein
LVFNPQHLFSRGTWGLAVERSASASLRVIHAGHHRTLFSDGRAGAAKRCSEHLPQEDCQCRNSEVTAVYGMSRWYYHSNSVVNIAHGYIRDLLHQAKLGGRIWTGSCDNTAHRSQRLVVRPLKSSDWPCDPQGPSWPSSPSITEWTEMLRKGIDPFSRDYYRNPSGHLSYTQVSRGELNRNCFLATLIVRNNFVAIRSSTAVPSKFTGYFRYRQNFLILTGTYSIPIGLVRFLIGQWITNPYSLWLRRAVLLKTFLRKVPLSLVLRARARLADSSVPLEPTRAGICTYPSDYDSEYYSEGSSALD